MAEHEDIPAMIDSAGRAAQQRDWPEAYRLWDAVLRHSSSHPAAYAGAGKALRELGRHDEAERILGEGAERFPANEQIAIDRAWLANARRDWPVALGSWEALRARFPHNPWCYLGNAYALRGSGSTDSIDPFLAAASAALASAKHRGLDASAAPTLEVEIAKARLDWDAVRQSIRSALSGGAAPSALMLLALAQACWHLGERDEADEAAMRALAGQPTLTEAVVIRAWVATERGDGDAALSCYRRLAELNPDAVRWSLKVIQLLNRLGRVQEAMSELQDMCRRWPDDPMVKTFLRNYGPAAAVCSSHAANADGRAAVPLESAEEDELRLVEEKAPGPAERKRALIAAEADREVLLGEVRGAQTAVLVFTGSNDSVSMPLPIFDLYLAALEVSAVYLKDFNRLRFLLGIRSLADDFPGTLSALREMLSRLKSQRVCAIGNCDGGFAAIRYGVELGADRIVAFCAPTHSPDESLSKIEQARNFMRRRLAEKVPAEMLDLKPFLESRKHRSRIDLFYEEEDARDPIQALHLAGLPGVTLNPQPGRSNHYLLRKLALSNDDFRGMLAQMLGVEAKSVR